MKLIIEPLEPYKVKIAELERRIKSQSIELDYLNAKVDYFEYNEGRKASFLEKENRKLKASLRKMYEKYIKPTQGMKLGVQGKIFGNPWPGAVPLSDYVEDMKSLMTTEELARAEEWGKIWEAASNPRPKPTSLVPLPKDPIEENPSWVTNSEERPWRKLALKNFDNGIS